VQYESGILNHMKNSETDRNDIGDDWSSLCLTLNRCIMTCCYAFLLESGERIRINYRDFV
jgi:hypothetical protein